MTTSNNLIIPQTGIRLLLYSNTPCPESMFSASLPSESASGMMSESCAGFFEDEQDKMKTNPKNTRNKLKCFRMLASVSANERIMIRKMRKKETFRQTASNSRRFTLHT